MRAPPGTVVSCWASVQLRRHCATDQRANAHGALQELSYSLVVLAIFPQPPQNLNGRPGSPRGASGLPSAIGPDPVVDDQVSTVSQDALRHYFALPKGAQLHEFQIEGILGVGGFGITYRAVDSNLQEVVAIKEYLPNDLAVRISDATIRAKTAADQPVYQAGLKAFLEEARMIARFRHPNIMTVRRFFELHGTGYIVLSFEQGRTLSQRL